MALIGYARVITQGQDLTAQLESLGAIAVDKLFQEKASGVKTDRPQLAALLDYVREGNTVVACKHRTPKDILAGLAKLEVEIQTGMDELTVMLGSASLSTSSNADR